MVLAGHSERRAIFEETDAFVNQKVKAGLDSGMIVIMCVGETSAERENGKTTEVITRQITKGLKDIETSRNLVIAYEPIWAISGGDPNKPKPIATKKQIEEMHGLIKKLLANQFGDDFIPVLYGGSANDKNAAEIFSMKGVDGVLVGGASLDPDKFVALINAK